ncbi:putative dehydrogenase [Frankia alni ACN14a]|uniref:Dehydrogenase n=3 Tax=Frankiaceae TaxID=74712 RepID=Q0RSM7_FRAAA|nr:putative dehydrogenase [Frankia alni ACN14a]
MTQETQAITSGTPGASVGLTCDASTMAGPGPPAVRGGSAPTGHGWRDDRRRHGGGNLGAKELQMSVLDRFRLDGRVAIVTGASSGLGVDFARGLAEAGADVVLGARRVERLEATAKLVEAAGRRALAVAVDVADPAGAERVAAAAMEAFGRVDVLVNNAGIGTAVPALKETPEQFRTVLDVNLSGCYWMAQAAARVMRPGSSIVNISSVLGLTTAGLPQAAYTASKAGLIGLTRDLAQQWTGRQGIRVNALAPGFFRSEMTDEYRPGYIETQLTRVLDGRFGEPAELTAALLFLASDAGSFVTGQTLVVDGGFSIT